MAQSTDRSALSSETSAKPAASQGSAPAPEAASTNGGSRQVVNRFGAIAINPENSIHFPKGLLGIAGHSHFCLADYPQAGLERFKILQSLVDDEMAFIVLPLEYANGLIETKDLDEAVKILGYDKEETAILLIVTVYRQDGQTQLTANVRAPLIIDAKARQAAQYVLPNASYQIRHIIAG